jgi:hypothetical protein
MAVLGQPLVEPVERSRDVAEFRGFLGRDRLPGYRAHYGVHVLDE